MTSRVINKVNQVSKLFQPMKIIPKGGTIKSDNSSKSYQLMVDLGIIRQGNPGMYTLLPLGCRALEKLIAIVDTEMTKIGGQKMLLPNLTNTKLWEKTGRIGDMNAELFKVTDRHEQSYILSPTYEEAITSLLASIGSPQKNSLPLLLYQISNKWRDEMKPRLGLFRSREFIMKDLYSFDIDMENAQKSYESVNQAYQNILSQIELPYIIAEGDTGAMGGSISHEYLYPAEIGEDTILTCKKCNFSINSAIYDDNKCKNCQGELEKISAIEVGHTFLLGTKYSKPLQATIKTKDSEIPLTMGSFGLGLTRLIAASLETLSSTEDLRWPKCIAPYTVCLIPPKENSKESKADHYSDEILEFLQEKNIDVIVDDRTHYTIGRRLLDARRTGYPYLIVIGKSAILRNPLFEIIDVNYSVKSDYSLDQLKDFFQNKGHENTNQECQERSTIVV